MKTASQGKKLPNLRWATLLATAALALAAYSDYRESEGGTPPERPVPRAEKRRRGRIDDQKKISNDQC